MKQAEETLQRRLALLITAMGYEFVGCELLRQGRQSLFRIYIDSDSGVTLEDCSKVSYQVSAMLDVEDPIQGRYTLEVSSPGLNRPLFERKHFQKYIGSQIKVRTNSLVNDRRRFVGTLLRVEEVNIYMLVDGIEMALPFTSVEKANVIADIRIR